MKPLLDATSRKRRPRLLGIVLVAFAVVLVLLARAMLSSEYVSSGSWGVTGDRKDVDGPAIGVLGGVPVSIAKPYANFVEYDDDPNWIEANKGIAPTRTYESRLSGFGFDLSYPSMEVISATTASPRQTEDIYSTMRMRVGVNSNAAYGSTGDTALEAYISNIPIQHGQPYRFEKLRETPFGLTGYTPIGVDTTRRNVIGMADMNDKNIYFHRDQEGRADAYIECSNMLHAAARCELRFNMLPDMRALVSVNFRKELLPHWRHIQSSVRTIILGFRVNPATTSTPVTKKGE